jgi:peptidoglycan hydrolase-like protein with peptidoglycan-binding domain
VFARSDVPRVTNVNFSVSVGTVVPTRVRVVAVPAAIIEIRPEFRNHLYFVVREEIVIVDNRRRIVAVIPVDSARGGGGVAVSGGVDFVDLSPDEIRQVQLVLIERGFSVEADGVFGPRTRQALIQFQRREGLTATGRIDSRTITSLGVSISSSQQPSTTGQGGGRQDAPANRGSGGAQSNSPQSSPMEQGKQSGAAPSGGQSGDQSSGSPATTGQGGGASAPASPRNSGSAGKPAAQPNSPSGGPAGVGGSPSRTSPSGGSAGGGQ